MAKAKQTQEITEDSGAVATVEQPPTLVGRVAGLLGFKAHKAQRTQTASERYRAMVIALAENREVDTSELESTAFLLGINLAGIEKDVAHVAARMKAVADLAEAGRMDEEIEQAYKLTSEKRRVVEAAEAEAKRMVDTAKAEFRSASDASSRMSHDQRNLVEGAKKALLRTADPAIATRLAEIHIQLDHLRSRQPNYLTVPQPWKGYSHRGPNGEDPVRMDNAAEIQRIEDRNTELRQYHEEQIAKLEAEQVTLHAKQMDPSLYTLPSTLSQG